LRESDEVVFADAGYTSDEYKRGARSMGMKWCVQDKRKPNSISSDFIFVIPLKDHRRERCLLISISLG